MKLKPLGERLVVKRKSAEEKTPTGLIIPDAAKEKPLEGTVIAAGNGRVLESGKVIPLDVKEGDRILFSKYAGTELKVDGEDLLMLSEGDVLGVLE